MSIFVNKNTSDPSILELSISEWRNSIASLISFKSLAEGSLYSVNTLRKTM